VGDTASRETEQLLQQTLRLFQEVLAEALVWFRSENRIRDRERFEDDFNEGRGEDSDMAGLLHPLRR